MIQTNEWQQYIDQQARREQFDEDQERRARFGPPSDHKPVPLTPEQVERRLKITALEDEVFDLRAVYLALHKYEGRRGALAAAALELWKAAIIEKGSLHANE